MTGNTMIDGKYVVEDVQKKLGRKVYPAEFANKLFIDELKNLYYADWLEMCWEPEHGGLILPTA